MYADALGDLAKPDVKLIKLYDINELCSVVISHHNIDAQTAR